MPIIGGGNTAAIVTDFDPDQEVLVIDPDMDIENFNVSLNGPDGYYMLKDIDLKYDGYSITMVGDDTHVTLNYVSSNQDVPVITNSIILKGVSGLQDSAIKIVTD